jgi:XapX domain-containing protein
MVNLMYATMIQPVAGITLGVAVGAGCRWFGIPSPAPPHVVGAVILIAMTLGFITEGFITAGIIGAGWIPGSS